MYNIYYNIIMDNKNNNNIKRGEFEKKNRKNNIQK